MESRLARLEAAMARLETKAVPTLRSADQRLDEIAGRLESLIAAGGDVAARTARGMGLPKVELQARGVKEGSKWVVEYQVGNKDIEVKGTKQEQVLYILGCVDSVIKVDGTFNTVTVDKCSKTAVIIQGKVGACEILNSTSVEIQFPGSTSAIVVDHTHGCQLHLGPDSLEAEITTARSAEVNAVVIGKTDHPEHAIPEQFSTKYKDGKFVTTPVAL